MKNFIRAAITALFALALGACATTAERDAAAKDAQAQTVMKADLLDTAKATAAAPLFKLTCPPNGCILASLEVGNPAAAAQMAEVVKVAFAPQPSVGAAIAHEFFDTIRTLGPVALVTHGISSIMRDVTSAQTATATAGFNAAGSTASSGFAANAAIAGHIPQPGATTTISVSGPGAAVATGGNATGSAPTTTTSTTTTTTNSNNTNPAPTVVTCTGDPVVCARG